MAPSPPSRSTGPRRPTPSTRPASTSSTSASTRSSVDEDIAVVVLRAEGKHFCAGHDLKELLAAEEPWAARRATPEGRLRHELARYWAPMVRLRDTRPITIAAVQGACSAAGLMLACMCDLIVAADDARFSNPVARMSGVGVELLVEPWEVGPRKAKELLLLAQKWDAADRRAPRPGQPGRRPRRPLGRGAADGRRRRPGAAADRRGHQAVDQRDARPDGPARLVAAALLDAPVRLGHARPPPPGSRPARPAAWPR